MGHLEQSKVLLLDTEANLSFGAPEGCLANTRDTDRWWVFNGNAWAPFGSAGGSSIRPNSFANLPVSPHAADDEFESTSLGWTRSVSGTTCVTGTVNPLTSVTPDCIQDLHGTWPSWLLLQSDESSAQTVTYTKAHTPATDATYLMRCYIFAASGGAIGANEASILLRLSNSGDANEWATGAYYATGAGVRSILVQVNNNGVLTTSSVSVGSGYPYVALFKDNDVYRAASLSDETGGLLTPAAVTKTGVTTFDQIELVFTTDNQTPSVIMGVDFVRFYDSITFGIRNP